MSSLALVVDDEVQMVSIVAFALQTQGFSCITTGKVRDAWDYLQSHDVDIAIIDVMLPDGSGIDLTRRIRSARLESAVILLSALSEETDRIKGLEAGADDYVTKPFSPRELALRAQAVLRRVGNLPSEDPNIVVGSLRIDLPGGKAYWADRRIDLSDTEFRVLAVLVEHEGSPVTYMQLLNEAWATTSFAGGREMIKTSVYRLRKRLSEVGAEPSLIQAVRGTGYVLSVEADHVQR